MPRMSKVQFIRTALQEGPGASRALPVQLYAISNEGAPLTSGVAVKNSPRAQWRRTARAEYFGECMIRRSNEGQRGTEGK